MSALKLAMCCAVVVLASSVVVEANQGRSGAPSGYFGQYVLTQSWTPGFCCTNSDKQECQVLKPTDWAATHMSLHGLWPQYSSSSAKKSGYAWPQYCQDAVDGNAYTQCTASGNNPSFCDPSQDVYNKFNDAWTKYAPGYVYDDHFLANHEWPKHGSCANLTIDTYFGTSINMTLSVGTPQLVLDNVGKSVSQKLLQNGFKFATGVQCDSSGRLTGIISCFPNNYDNNLPGQQVDCGNDVMSSSYDNSCSSYDNIYIASSDKCTE